MKSFNQVFFRGLITLLPITLTIYILYSAVIILENLLGSLLKFLLPPSAYIPGLGFILTLLLIYAFGLLLNNYLAARILLGIENRFAKVPFLRTIYSPLRDLMNLFSQKNQKNMGSVVLVKLSETGVQQIGIVTRENFDDLNLGRIGADRVTVYMPFSYALGGISVMVPRSQITELDLPIEKAMSLAITGWVKADQKSETEMNHGN